MGNSQTSFTEEELQDYQDLTYLSKTEILHIFKRFKSLSPQTFSRQSAKTKRVSDFTLPITTITELEELKNNPFCERICKVFSSSRCELGDREGEMSFEDFLDMMSVFSGNAPKQIKVEYAFKIYDFDEDDKIGREDLREIVSKLTGAEQDVNRRLSDQNMEELINKILEEADLDGDGSLSFAEFEHVISKAPDFVNSFRMRL